MDIVVREVILVILVSLMAVLSRTATLLFGSVFVLAQELAEVGDAINGLTAS